MSSVGARDGYASATGQRGILKFSTGRFESANGIRMRDRRPSDIDARAWPYLDHGNESLELSYLRAGSDPDWERPHRGGVDITDRPDLWTPYQRARRERYEERVADYRRRGLI